MASKSKVISKAIRLTSKEEAQINEFLLANPFFDFSSLARTAILGFIRQPTVAITPIAEEKPSRRRHADV
jgi:hypothetical protein